MTLVLKESAVQLLTVFAIAASGYLLGRIRIRGVGLGTAAIFLTGLVFGHFGAQIPAILQTVGLVLFITPVGLNAGATFVQRMRTSGRAYAVLCLAVALSGALVCAGIIRLCGVDAPLAVGMMTGAFTTSPGFAAAKEAVSASAEAVGRVAAGYGVIYPLGVVSKVLFVQLVPRLLHADMAYERSLIAVSGQKSRAEARSSRVEIDPWGLFALALSAVLGILLGAVTVPLPGGADFSLGTTGGALIAGLVIGHIGSICRFALTPDSDRYGAVKELGLVLFFSGSGVEGGHGLAEILSTYGLSLLLYGLALVAVPLAVGYFMFRRVLRLPLLNGLGSITASMTSTPSLAALVQAAGTDDVAAAYATTYPIALIVLVLLVQVLVNV